MLHNKQSLILSVKGKVETETGEENGNIYLKAGHRR